MNTLTPSFSEGGYIPASTNAAALQEEMNVGIVSVTTEVIHVPFFTTPPPLSMIQCEVNTSIPGYLLNSVQKDAFPM